MRDCPFACVCALLGLCELAQSGALGMLHSVAYLYFGRTDERHFEGDGGCVIVN